MPNKVHIGAPGSGKSFSALVELKNLAVPRPRLGRRKEKNAILLADPHGSLAIDFMTYLVRYGQEHRVIYDRLTDSDRVLGWKFLRRPTGTGLEWEKEEDAMIHDLMDIFLWRRGVMSSWETPFFERGLLFALRLILRQKTYVSLLKLLFALKTNTWEFRKLLDGCTDRELVERGESMIHWNASKKEKQLEPADRLIEAVLESPVVAARIGEEFDPWDHYEKGGIVIIEGSTKLSTDALRSMMGLATFNAVSFAKSKGTNESLSLS